MIRWTAGAQNTRDESTKFATLQDAITAVGSNNATLYILAGTYNISADLTVPANVTLNLERGAVLAVATTKTLTINGLIEAGFYQVFSWTGTGAIVLSGLQPVKTSWFGDTATGINKGLLSVSRPCVFKMPGKYIDLGTTSIEIYTCGHTLQGQGVDFSGNHYHGTRLDYSGSGYAILVGKAGVFSAKIGLKDFGVYKTGAGSKGIRMGLADPDWIRYPYMENVVVMDSGWQGSHGMVVLGSEYGIYRRCEFSYNGGAGLVFGDINLTYGGHINRFHSCSFSYNHNEGVYIKSGGNLVFANCDVQGNYYEGLKAYTNAVRTIDNLTIEHCWFEGNQADATHTNGYYGIHISDNHVGRVVMRHNSMRGVAHPYDSSTGLGNKLAYVICSELTIDGNAYGDFAPTFTKPYNYVDGIVCTINNEDFANWQNGGRVRLEGTLAAWTKSPFYPPSSSGVDETNLLTWTIPAKTITYVPTTIDTSNPTRQSVQSGGLLNNFLITVYGTKAGSAGNKTIKLYWGSQVIATIGPSNNTNLWYIEAMVSFRDSGLQTIFVRAWDGDSGSGTMRVCNHLNGSQNEQNDILIKVTGQCANAADSITNYFLAVKPY